MVPSTIGSEGINARRCAGAELAKYSVAGKRVWGGFLDNHWYDIRQLPKVVRLLIADRRSKHVVGCETEGLTIELRGHFRLIATKLSDSRSRTHARSTLPQKGPYPSTYQTKDDVIVYHFYSHSDL